MRTIWHSLIWKEWHEHKWKLVAITSILCGVTLLIVPRLPHDLSADYFLTYFAMLPLGLFIGAAAASGERSRRTEAFLQALPVPLWRVGLHKAVSGLLTLITAISLTFLFVFGCLIWKLGGLPDNEILTKAWTQFPPPSIVSNWFLSAPITVCLAAASLFAWTVAAGAKGTDEVSAGARAAIAIIGWWVLLAAVAKWIEQTFGVTVVSAFFEGNRKLVAAVFAISPGSAGAVFPKWESITSWAGSILPVVVGVAFHLGLIAIFVIRFGRVTGRPRSWPTAMATASPETWPRAPWNSQTGAIVWKQFRESTPIVGVGLAGALGFAAISAVTSWHDVLQHPSMIAEVIAGATIVIGIFVTLVVGIGVSYSDAGRSLNEFWRSRPINPDLWYWSKCASGLLILLFATLLPAAPAYLLDPRPDNPPYIVLAICGGLTSSYLAAVAVTSVVRHAVYSAILSIATLWAGYLIVWLGVSTVHRLLAHEPVFQSLEEHPSVPLMVTGLTSVAIAVTLFGWLAVRYDWGRKHS
jgi:ABC-type transport system involved in multi-copper enzyme maturation permease subunit